MPRGRKRLPDRDYRLRFKSADPAIREIVDQALDRKITFTNISKRSGIAASAMYMWHVRSPSIASVRAVLNTLGLDLAVVPKKEDSTNE